MDAWAKLNWERTPEDDSHRDYARNPYQGRETQSSVVPLPSHALRITDFVSRYALGDNLSVSQELLLRSQRLLAESRTQIRKCRMRLLMSHLTESSQ